MESVTSADGTRIAYERSGSGSPLVLVHGTTADHARWEPVLSALAERFTVYAIDRRGRGQSGDAEEYAIEREADDVVAVVESIGERVSLLGHSYGALVSMEAALRIDDLRAVVLYEPPVPGGDHDPDSADALSEMEAMIDAGEREQALVTFFREIASMPEVEVDALAAAPNWQARVEAVHTALREERARKAYEFDPTRFEALTAPTLLLVGSETAPFHREVAGILDETLPNSRVGVLEGQAHAGMSTAPDLFVDEVLPFLVEQE